MKTSFQRLEQLLIHLLDVLKSRFPLTESVNYITAIVLVRFIVAVHEKQLRRETNSISQNTNIPDISWDAIAHSYNPEQQIIETARAIEFIYPEYLNGFSTILPIDSLVKDSQLCRRIVNAISEIDFVEINDYEIADMTDSLFEITASFAGVQGGESYTPKDISTLIVQLVAPKQRERIYDPSCGTGGFLIESHQFANNQKNNSSTKIVGQEINKKTAAIARINAYLHHIYGANIHSINSLTSTSSHSEKFDVVISNPPIGIKLNEDLLEEIKYNRNDFKYGNPTRVADFNFIQNAIASLTDRGRSVLLIGLRPLFIEGQEGDIRRRIIEEDLVEAVITLPENLLPQTTAKSAILVLNKNKPEEKKNKIQFISAENEYHVKDKRRIIDSTHREKIVKTFQDVQNHKGFAIFINTEFIKSNDFSLLPERYLNPDDFKVVLGEDIEWFDLTTDATVIQGSKLNTKIEGNIPIIQGRDLTVSGLSVDNLEKKDIPKDSPKAIYSQNGDILVQRIGQRPRFFLVENSLTGIIISDTVFVIRPNKDDRSRSRYLVEFLNSNAGQVKVSSAISGAVIPSLSITKLRQLKIPVPNNSVIELIENLHETEQSLIASANKARVLKQQLFSIDDPETFNSQLQALSVESEVLNRSIVNAEDLTFQIRNYYPYTLAYTYRSLDAYVEPSTLYKEQLRVAENLLAFLASIGLSLITDKMKSSSSERNDLTKQALFDYWQGGISPGDWRDIAYKSAQLLRGEGEEFAAITNFAGVWFKGRGAKESEFGALTKTLVKLKNDFKHDRYPQTYEYENAIQKLRDILHHCYQSLGFFIQHPIRFVQNYNQDWQTGLTTLNTLVYIGDHPGLKQEQIIIKSPVPKEHLYLELNKEKLTALYPLISVHYCDSCKTPETYMIDFWNKSDGKLRLKSFERGHIHENNEIARKLSEDLDFWMQNMYPL